MHRATWDTRRRPHASLTRLSRSLAPLSSGFSSHSDYHVQVPQPRRDKSPRFRLFRFRSPLLTESRRFLFLGLLRCFTSPRFALPDYEFIRSITRCDTGWVVPFGDLWVKACATAHHSLSQFATSFIAYWHQGIHHKPLVA